MERDTYVTVEPQSLVPRRTIMHTQGGKSHTRVSLLSFSLLFSSTYMDSMWSAYFFITTLRLSLSVGVSSSVVTEKSQGRMVNFWILEAFEGHTYG